MRTLNCRDYENSVYDGRAVCHVLFVRAGGRAPDRQALDAFEALWLIREDVHAEALAREWAAAQI